MIIIWNAHHCQCLVGWFCYNGLNKSWLNPCLFPVQMIDCCWGCLFFRNYICLSHQDLKNVFCWITLPQAGLPSFGSFGGEQLKEPACFKILFWWLVVPLQQWHPVLPNTPRRWNTELIFIMLATRLWTWFIFVGVKLITEPVFDYLLVRLPNYVFLWRKARACKNCVTSSILHAW